MLIPAPHLDGLQLLTSDTLLASIKQQQRMHEAELRTCDGKSVLAPHVPLTGHASGKSSPLRVNEESQ